MLTANQIAIPTVLRKRPSPLAEVSATLGTLARGRWQQLLSLPSCQSPTPGWDLAETSSVAPQSEMLLKNGEAKTLRNCAGHSRPYTLSSQLTPLAAATRFVCTWTITLNSKPPTSLTSCKLLHPAKLTWNLKGGPPKRTVVCKGAHVPSSSDGVYVPSADPAFRAPEFWGCRAVTAKTWATDEYPHDNSAGIAKGRA